MNKFIEKINKAISVDCFCIYIIMNLYFFIIYTNCSTCHDVYMLNNLEFSRSMCSEI